MVQFGHSFFKEILNMRYSNNLYHAQEFNNIKEIIYNSVEQYSKNIAFVIKHTENKKVEYENITYKQLLEDINKLGTAVYSLGFKEKRIAVIGRNSYEWAIAHLSNLLGGNVSVPLDKDLQYDELENSLIRSKADMIFFDKKYEEKISQIKEKNNITYTMLNYTYGTNGMKVPNDYLVNVWPTDIDNINNPEKDTKYQEYKKQVKQDVEKVRDKVDVLIVAMHWGVEYTHNPTEYEKDMASYLASLGVDLIIGTHPHVIQPVTWIDNTLVIYSLGNFLSAQYQNQSTCTNYKCTTGLMTSLKIEKDVKGKEKSIKITNVENELIYNYYNQSTWRGFKVIPFSNPEIKTYLPSYKSVYNTYKEVVQRLDSNMYVKETVE